MLFQQVIAGLITGSLYALVALGLVMAYKVTEVMNFAYGYMAMISAYIFYSLFVVFGLNYASSFALAVLVGVGMGYVVERGLLRPVRYISPTSMVIITLGVLLVLQGLALQIWGNEYQHVPNALNGKPLIFRTFGGIVVIPQQSLLIVGIVFATVIFLFLYLKFTYQGMAFRATSQNEEAAKLMGINTNLNMSLSWMISGALGAAAAILAAPQTFVYPDMMLNLQIMGFTAAVLGGFDSILGAIIGGVTLGVVDNLVGAYLSNNLRATFSLAIIVAILLVRPEGIFGRPKSRRV